MTGKQRRLFRPHVAEVSPQVSQHRSEAGACEADAVAREGGHPVAFEIETGNSDIAGNVRKVPPDKFDKLVVATSARARAKARGLQRPDLEFIRPTDLEDFLTKKEGMLGGQKSEGKVL